MAWIHKYSAFPLHCFLPLADQAGIFVILLAALCLLLLINSVAGCCVCANMWELYFMWLRLLYSWDISSSRGARIYHGSPPAFPPTCSFRVLWFWGFFHIHKDVTCQCLSKACFSTEGAALLVELKLESPKPLSFA